VTSVTLAKEQRSAPVPDATADPRVVDVPVEEAQRHLFEAIDGLRLVHPELSAHRVLSRGQRRVLAAVAALSVAGLVVSTLTTLRVFIGLITATYVAAVWYRWRCFRTGVDRDAMVRVSDDAELEGLDTALHAESAYDFGAVRAGRGGDPGAER